MRALPVIMLLSSLLGCSDSSDRTLQLLTPRPYGYWIGDKIPHRILLETHNGVKLNTNGLPKIGAINRWLNLNAITVNSSKSGSRWYYEIDLVYQVFYAPLEVKMLNIPGFTLPLSQGENHASETVPSWSFTISPLRELAVRKDDTGEYMRPDATPPLLFEQPIIRTLLISLIVAVLSTVYLAYSYGYLPLFPKRLIFKPLLKKLQAMPEQRLNEALALVHDALNRLNGGPLFAHQLNNFFQRHRHYELIRSEFTIFFENSNQFFFAEASMNAAETLAQLIKLCAYCDEIEQGSR